MFIDQLTDVFPNLLIPEYLPTGMGPKKPPKWEKKCGLRRWYWPIPIPDRFRALLSYLPVCAKEG
jgi:hypothetical protein